MKFYWLRKAENRVYQHLFFWLCYYGYRVLIYGDIVNTYENVAYVQLLELPVKIALVYFNLYVLMPRFLKKGYNLTYAVTIMGSLIVATMLQRYVIALCISVDIYAPVVVEVLYSARRFIRIMHHILNIVIVTSLIKIAKDRYQSKKLQHALVRDKLETELKYLRAQMTPHFLFNTLNSIYALSLEKSNQTSEAILKLSNLMSYMLYDTRQKSVSLKKEIANLKDYIELEKLRSDAKVDFNIQGDFRSFKIAPAILIAFVENSFKHVAESEEGSGWIKIKLIINGSLMRLEIANSADKLISGRNQIGGIGLNNVKRRLTLLYRKKYQLKTSFENGEFKVNLAIDLRTKPVLKTTEV